MGALVVSFGILSWPSEAEAKKKKRVWSVKFKCLFTGNISTGFFEGLILVVDTQVNIHNPAESAVSFNKKFVIVAPEFKLQPSRKTEKEGVTLSANLSHAVNCSDIVTALTAIPITPIDYAINSVIEGWVVIEAARDSLAVCAIYQEKLYSDTGATAAGISIHPECYKPKKLSGAFELEELEGPPE